MEARPSLHLSKCQIVGNLNPRLNYSKCCVSCGLECITRTMHPKSVVDGRTYLQAIGSEVP